ncbi:MAG: nucleotidyltransferase family protein, partial [Acidobacteria bacterium]|nr:nucleotidyltransferase family protein [Acidobacteriota bacterium]
AYGDPFVKSAIDVDLLVPEDVVPAAANVLRTLGWRRVMPAFRETPLRRRWYDSVQKDDAFTGGRAKVELHRRLFNNRSLFNPSFDRLQAAAATVAIGTRRFRTLDDADQLLYLACHGALHFWYRLKWLCDFAALVGVMDRETVRRALADGHRAGLGTVLASALRLCREDLQAEIPAAGASAPAPGPRERFVVALSRRVWTPRSGVRRLGPKAAMRMGRGFLAGGLRYRLHEARALLIAHGDFARVNLPDRLFWLYPLVQPALLAQRIFRGRL